MNGYEQAQMRIKIAKRGKIMIILGLIIIVTGIILVVSGITSQGLFGLTVAGGFSIVIGFAIAGFGGQFLFASKAGKITQYFAKESSPAMKTTSEAVADGIASGLKKHGMGIGQKEVIKVKCRNCGYLETEDAEFCSKCGKSL